MNINYITDGQLPNEIPVGHIIMNGGDETIVVHSNVTNILINSFTGEKRYDDFTHAEQLNYINCIGALLWKDTITGELVIDNGDINGDDEGQYWDPHSSTISTPSKTNCDLIGVNVGLGLWAYISWGGLTTTYKWAASNSDAIYITNIKEMIHTNGYDATNYLLTNYGANIAGTIWEEIQTKQDNGVPVYLPSKIELLIVQNNCCDNNHSGSNTSCTYTENIGRLLSLSTYHYWSSSQYPNGYNYSYYVYFSFGNVSYCDKTYQCRSVALLHFVAA